MKYFSESTEEFKEVQFYVIKTGKWSNNCPWNAGNFLTSWETVSFTRRTLLRAVSWLGGEFLCLLNKIRFYGSVLCLCLCCQ